MLQIELLQGCGTKYKYQGSVGSCAWGLVWWSLTLACRHACTRLPDKAPSNSSFAAFILIFCTLKGCQVCIFGQTSCDFSARQAAGKRLNIMASGNSVVPVSRLQNREEYQRVEYLLQVSLAKRTLIAWFQRACLLAASTQPLAKTPSGAVMLATYWSTKLKSVACGECTA